MVSAKGARICKISRKTPLEPISNLAQACKIIRVTDMSSTAAMQLVFNRTGNTVDHSDPVFLMALRAILINKQQQLQQQQLLFNPYT